MEVQIDLYKFCEDVTTKLSRIETILIDIAGNGRPGRLDRLELSVANLQKYKSKTKGAIIGITGILSALSALAVYLAQIILRKP